MSVYNGATQLRETLESMVSQQGVDFELIVVNDGSTDQSRVVLQEYADKDKRVVVLDQQNQGLTKSLISGCSIAKGKYVARHDVGDVSEPDRLALQRSALEASEDVAFVSCWTEFLGPEWEFLYLVKGTGSAASPTFIISEAERHGTIDGPTHHGSVMFRKEAYFKAGGYRPEFYFGQDWDLWYRLAEIGKFQTLQQSLYKVRLAPDSISAMNKQRQSSIGRLSLDALRLRMHGLSDESALNEAKTIRPKPGRNGSAKHRGEWLYFIGECLRRNNDKRSATYFVESLRSHPLNIAAFLKLVQVSLRSK